MSMERDENRRTALLAASQHRLSAVSEVLDRVLTLARAEAFEAWLNRYDRLTEGDSQ